MTCLRHSYILWLPDKKVHYAPLSVYGCWRETAPRLLLRFGVRYKFVNHPHLSVYW